MSVINKKKIEETVKNRLKIDNPYLSKLFSKIEEIVLKVQSRLGQAKSVIGLDIGTTSVKLAQTADIEGETTLIKTAFVDIESRDEKDLIAATLVALKKALSGIDTKAAILVCVVDCPKTCVRNIIIPPMPKREMLEAVRWEARNYIPFSIDQAVLDFTILGEVIDKDVKKLNVAVAAAPQETVNKQLSLFAQLGMKVSLVIPASIALQNLIAKSKLKRDETVAIVELGATITELSIYKNYHLEFARKFPVAGSDITKSMTGALASQKGRVQLSTEEAEKIKKQWGLPSSDKSEMIEDKISTSQILSLIRPAVEQLANEIERSFDSYQEGSKEGKVDRIILFGGGARLKGLVEFLSDELGLDVKIGNSLEDLKILSGAVAEKDIISHRLDLAVGAALGNVKLLDLIMDKGINLLPLKLKEETKRFVKNVSLKVIVAAVLTLLLLFYIGMRIQLEASEKKLTAAKVEYGSLAPQAQELYKKILIGRAFLNRPHWEDTLKEISNVVPFNIYLTKLSMKNDIFNLKGIIIQSNQTAEAALSNFMMTLEKGIFKNVTLVTTSKKAENSTTSEFEIKCEID